MRCRGNTTWFWNTGQKKRNFLVVYFLLFLINQGWARPDFLDTMSRQFFGMPDNNEQSQQQYQSSPDPFMEMFGSSNQQVSQRHPPPNHQHSNRQAASRPHRQGYYAPPHGIQQPVHHPHVVQQAHLPHVIQQQAHPPYNGPPPVYGEQQGFGQRRPDGNETKTEGFPPDNPRRQHAHQLRHPYQAADYHPPHHNQQVVAVEYPKPPATVIEYQTQYPQHSPQQVEYHHIPQQPAIVEEHGPALEIHTGNDHAYHEPPTHVEYHHPPEVEYHHHPPHKPKGFHLSFNQPSPDYKIIDQHIKLPPVKFRFHINPKIVITSNTKDPLEKKHHDDEHDLEPYPPPDAFSDHNAPPSINKHVIEHYPVKHHYPVEHHAVKHPYPVEHHAVKHSYPVEHHAINHHATGYPEPKHHYAIGHQAVEHHPGQEYVYDLSHGHSHLNPHRSLGHYEPTFKVKTKPIIFTEPPPTPPTTTTRATTTTARTTTARTTARTTTTARPTRRARISARNPGFSVAFTPAATTSGTTEASTTTNTTTRRSIFRSNSERERENGGISARRDEVSTSAEASESTNTTTSTTTTSKPASTTTPKPSSTGSSTLTSTQSTTTSNTPGTTTAGTTTTTTTPTAPKTTTTTTTTTPKTTTTATTTTPKTTTTATTTTPKTTTTTTTTTTSKPTTFPSLPTIRNRISPAEETTVRTTTFNVDTNEIDMKRTTESPRRRPEPLLERMGLGNIESSESVKVIETTMLIEGKNQTVRFYYITQPVKLPLDVFQKMTGQSKDNTSGVNVIKIRDKRYAILNQNSELLRSL